MILLAVTSATAIQPAIPEERTHTVQDPDLTALLLTVDRRFNARAQEVGVPAAFIEFAAEDAVMYRNGMEPVVGREAIRELLEMDPDASLVWEPLTADIAASADLGYTRGRFTYMTAPGPDGTPPKGPYMGYYVSIWKKQADGSWKWVFDSGIISKLPKEQPAET